MAKRKNLRQLNIKISNLDGRKVAAGDQHIFSKAMLNGAIKQHGDTITRKQTIVDALEQDVKLGLTEIGQALMDRALASETSRIEDAQLIKAHFEQLLPQMDEDLEEPVE